MEQKPITPPKTLKSFGVDYVYQGTFENAEELILCKSVWRRIGHSVMIRNHNQLYASQAKTRNY